jgi:hypothetical protein
VLHKSQGTDREIQLAWCVSIPQTSLLLSRFHYGTSPNIDPNHSRILLLLEDSTPLPPIFLIAFEDLSLPTYNVGEPKATLFNKQKYQGVLQITDDFARDFRPSE